jgi:hypothetical protein
LQIGQISGGPSRAHKYPQTLHLHTGKGSGWRSLPAGTVAILFLSSAERRLSGIGPIFLAPEATASET